MRVAVVGTGVAGLGLAYALSRGNEVELFERESWAGGHTHTIRHRVEGGRAGHRLHRHERAELPHAPSPLRRGGVRTQESELSFSVGCARCGLEYSGRRPFARARNLARPGFLRLLAEIARWLRESPGAAANGATLGEHVAARGYSHRFRDHFLVPLTAAIWSRRRRARSASRLRRRYGEPAHAWID